MAEIFLSGGGSAEQTRKLDKVFVSKIKRKRILYIPVAMPEAKHTRGECFDWIKSTMSKLGVTSIDMWTEVSNRKYNELREYGAIYLGGGNTFNLLNILRKGKFDILLRKYAQSGGVIYGGSAGAIIFGRDIRTASFGGDADKNQVGLRKFNGLKMVGKYSIQCHYLPSHERAMLEYVRQTGFPAIALPDNSGLYVCKDFARVIGSGAAILFTKKEKSKLNIGSSLKI